MAAVAGTGVQSGGSIEGLSSSTRTLKDPERGLGRLIQGFQGISRRFPPSKALGELDRHGEKGSGNA
ncbi:hypothetical protein RJ035_007729, partial [Blastomyces gilchristii]